MLTGLIALFILLSIAISIVGVLIHVELTPRSGEIVDFSL